MKNYWIPIALENLRFGKLQKNAPPESQRGACQSKTQTT